jgi:hypothetical protein
MLLHQAWPLAASAQRRQLLLERQPEPTHRSHSAATPCSHGDRCERAGHAAERRPRATRAQNLKPQCSMHSVRRSRSGMTTDASAAASWHVPHTSACARAPRPSASRQPGAPQQRGAPGR